jgi:hypothetical protein
MSGPGPVRRHNVPVSPFAVRRLLVLALGVGLFAGVANSLEDEGGQRSASGSAVDQPAAAQPTTAAASGGGGPASRGQAASRLAPVEPMPAAADLSNFSCTRDDGVWSAEGDITNSARVAMVYTVTVAAVDGAGVSGQDSAQVLLRPGASTSFDLPEVAEGAADACLPRLLRTPR